MYKYLSKGKLFVFVYMFTLFAVLAQEGFSEYNLISKQSESNTTLSTKSTNFIATINELKSTKSSSVFNVSDVNKLKHVNTVKIDLTDDGVYRFSMKEIEEISDSKFLWKGENDFDDIITMFYNNGKLTGLIKADDNSYRIEFLQENTYLLIKEEKDIISKASVEQLMKLVDQKKMIYEKISGH